MHSSAHVILQLRPSLHLFTHIQSILLLLRAKINTYTIHTMPLILRIAEPLPLKDMPEMASAVITHNLCPHHA
jgi:hypothetical protein